MLLFAMRHSEATYFDSIALVDFRSHGGSFRETLQLALHLIQDHDPRRYLRIKEYIRWIANRVTNMMGIEYNFSLRACSVEFTDVPGACRDVLAAGYACFLVHEATHGAVENRGIPYDAKNRVRIERLCMEEQNRFAARLAAVDPQRYPIDLLRLEFDENYWKNEWTAGRAKKTSSFLSRWFADMHPQQHAPPNAGSAGAPPSSPS